MKVCYFDALREPLAQCSLYNWTFEQDFIYIYIYYINIYI